MAVSEEPGGRVNCHRSDSGFGNTVRGLTERRDWPHASITPWCKSHDSRCLGRENTQGLRGKTRNAGARAIEAQEIIRKRLIINGKRCTQNGSLRAIQEQGSKINDRGNVLHGRNGEQWPTNPKPPHPTGSPAKSMRWQSFACSLASRSGTCSGDRRPTLRRYRKPRLPLPLALQPEHIRRCLPWRT